VPCGYYHFYRMDSFQACLFRKAVLKHVGSHNI
jgi:hypothetical protein